MSTSVLTVNFQVARLCTRDYAAQRNPRRKCFSRAYTHGASPVRETENPSGHVACTGGTRDRKRCDFLPTGARETLEKYIYQRCYTSRYTCLGELSYVDAERNIGANDERFYTDRLIARMSNVRASTGRHHG